MITFSCKCGDENPTKLVIRGASFECADPITPEDETMIAPLNLEAYNPEGTVIVGKRVFLGYAPVLMNLNAGLTIVCAYAGTGTMSVDVYADEQKMFTVPVILSPTSTDDGAFIKVPRSGIRPEWQTIPAGKRLDVEVQSLSLPSGYPQWRGLQVCFLPSAIADLP